MTDSWSTLTDFNVNVREIRGGTYDDKFYCCGGNGNLNGTDVYDPDSGWSALANMGTNRRLHQAAIDTDNGVLYVFGGYNTGDLSTAEKYVIATNTWSSIASMSGTLRNTSACYYNGKIYMFGGYNGATYINQTLIYDIATNSYSTGTNYPLTGGYFNCVAYEGNIYIFGGYNQGTTSYTTACYKYDIAADSFSSITALPNTRGRTNVGNIRLNDKVFIVGGYNGSAYTNTTYVYDITNDSWDTSLDNAPYTCGTACGGFIRDKLYMLQGYNNTADDAGFMVFDSSIVPSPTLQREDVIAWYPLENTLSDYHNAYDLTQNGSASNTSESLGFGIGSWSFPGTTSDYLSSSSTSVYGLTEFSISLWTKPTAKNTMICAQHNSAVSRTFYIYCRATTGYPEIEVTNSAGTNYSIIGTTDLTDGNPHHIVLTADIAGNLTLYVDGAVEGTPVALSGTTLGYSAADTFIIGKRTSGLPLTGYVKNVLVTNRELISLEVEDLYNSGVGKTWTDYFGLDDGLKYYYSLNTDGTDSTGTTNLTVSGATNTTGYLSNGMSFDGTNDYLNGTLTIPASFTIVFWMKANEAVPTTRDRILALNDDSSPYIYLDHKNSSGNLECYVTSSGGNAKYFDTGYSSTDWNHIVIRYDSSSDSLYYFKNGVAVIAGGSEVGTSAWAGATGNFQLGIAWDLSTYPFNGYLDEFGIWERALTAGEVKRLYNYGCGRTYTEITGSESPLLEGFRDGYDGDDLTSIRGLAGSGTAGGDAAAGAAGGVIGDAYTYDGTGDYIDFADATPAETQDFFVQIWLNADTWDSGDIPIIAQNAAATERAFYLQYQATGTTLTFNVRNSANTTWYGGNSGTIGTTPHHFIGGFDSDAPEVVAYHNGGSKNSLDTTSFTRSVVPTTVRTGIHPNSSSNPYDGLLDLIYFWNRKPTAADAVALYNSAAAIAYPFSAAAAASGPNDDVKALFFGGGI